MLPTRNRKDATRRSRRGGRDREGGETTKEQNTDQYAPLGPAWIVIASPFATSPGRQVQTCRN